MNRRGLAALAILVAWIGGLGVLVRREYFRPHIERLAEAALRVSPEAVFYAVLQGDRQVGFASSTIDTTTSSVEQRDYFVAELAGAGGVQRTELRTTIELSRTLRLRRFESLLESGEASVRVAGAMEGDSILHVVTERGNATPDSQRVTIASGILLPELVPLAIALAREPDVGDEFTLPVFVPSAVDAREMQVGIVAETLFVVNDSSAFDSTAGHWVGVLPDTMRAWEISGPSGSGIHGWVDERGRLVATTQLGFHLERRPYEVAFENWRRLGGGVRETGAAAPAAPADTDISTRTALAARLRPNPAQTFAAVIRGASRILELDGGRQSLRGDTIVVTREADSVLVARYALGRQTDRSNPNLRPEQFLEAGHADVAALAATLAGRTAEPELVARRLLEWVHDSVQPGPPTGIPSALHALHARVGDAAEQAQLFVALARAAGIPARTVTGLAYGDGQFHPHVWAEVTLRGWVAVDPVFGQFPADASRLRLLTGGVAREPELLRLLGNLQLDVLTTR